MQPYEKDFRRFVNLKKSRIYTRGAAYTTETELFANRLGLKNVSSGEPGEASPGLFFHEGSVHESEIWARRIAQREQKEPYVFQLSVTSQNFHIIERGFRVVWVDFDEERFITGGREDYYYLPQDFMTLMHGQATINMNNISPKDLVALYARVGLLDKESDTFKYRDVTLVDFRTRR